MPSHSFRSRGGSFRGGSSRGGGSNTHFTGKSSSFRGGRGGSRPGVAYGIDRPAPKREDDGSAAAERFEEVKVQDEIDGKLGFWRFESALAAGQKRVGWLVNMHQVSFGLRLGGCVCESEGEGEGNGVDQGGVNELRCWALWTGERVQIINRMRLGGGKDVSGQHPSKISRADVG